MAPSRRHRDRRLPGSDRPGDTHGFESKARDAGKDFRNGHSEQDRRGEQPELETRTRTKKLRPKSGPLGPVPSEIESVPPFLDDEGTHKPPVKPVKVRVVENRPLGQGGGHREKQDGKEKHPPSEPGEREKHKTTDSPSSPAGRVRGARRDFEKARETPRMPGDDHTQDTRTSSAKTERPRAKRKPLELEDAIEDPYVRGLYEKAHGPVEQASRGHLRDVFAELVQETTGQAKEVRLERDPEAVRVEKRKVERVENQSASDAIRKVMEHGIRREGGARAAFERYQNSTMDQLGDLSETVSRLDTGRALKVRNRTEDLVKSLRGGADPVTALRQFQLDRMIDRQTAMMDVGKLTIRSLGRLTDTSFNHQDGCTGASSAVMEAYRRVEKDILASSPLKPGPPTTTDFSHIQSPETFKLKLTENHAESKGAVRMAKDAEEGKLLRLGIVSSVGFGCSFAYEREEGKTHYVTSWHKAFTVSNANTAAVSSREFSRPAVASYVRQGEGENARMHLEKVGLLGDKAWEDLRLGKTYEDLYTETKGMNAIDVAGRLLPFAGGGADNRFSVYGRSGPLGLNVKAAYQMTVSKDNMMVRNLGRFTVTPEEMKDRGVMRTFSAEELGHAGKYISQVNPRTGNFLTDFTTGSWMLASVLGANPQAIAERKLTRLKDSSGAEHNVESVRQEIEGLRRQPETQQQKLRKLFTNAQTVEFETVRPARLDDPLTGLVVDRAVEGLGDPFVRTYRNLSRNAVELVEGTATSLQEAGFESLAGMIRSPRREGVTKTGQSVSAAEVGIGQSTYRGELRERHDGSMTLGRVHSVGRYSWGRVSQQEDTVRSPNGSATRVFDGYLASGEGRANPEVFVYVPSAYSRQQGKPGELYDCLEHIRTAPSGFVREFPVGDARIAVKGQDRSDYRDVFMQLVKHEMSTSRATTDETGVQWLREHVDPTRTIGIVSSLSLSAKMATTTKRGAEMFTEFGASVSVGSTIIAGSPENLSGRLHSAGVTAGEGRIAAERGAFAGEPRIDGDSQRRSEVSFDVIEVKKQSSPRKDGFTGSDGKFVLRCTFDDGQESSATAEVWTRSAGTKRRGILSQDTVLPDDRENTIRISIGQVLPELQERGAAIKRGRPLETVFEGTRGYGVRVVSMPTGKGALPESTGDDKDQ